MAEVKDKLQSEVDRLDAAVDQFAVAMKARLREKAVLGWDMWDRQACREFHLGKCESDLRDLCYSDRSPRNLTVDIANRMMMLFIQEGRA